MFDFFGLSSVRQRRVVSHGGVWVACSAEQRVKAVNRNPPAWVEYVLVCEQGRVRLRKLSSPRENHRTAPKKQERAEPLRLDTWHEGEGIVPALFLP